MNILLHLLVIAINVTATLGCWPRHPVLAMLNLAFACFFSYRLGVALRPKTHG